MNHSRKERTEFHISSDDYFATLATVLDLIKQQSEKTLQELKGLRENIRQLENLKKDLIFLQKNYQIIEKIKPR